MAALGRQGFTLVEMLIAVTLVLLMMVLFAEIFGLASESMELQRAIADGDQNVRSVTTVLRSDLQKRTFRDVVPYSSLENLDFQTTPFSNRQGYIYISLNDPDNATDNLLQFTVRSTITKDIGDETPYYGRATGIVQRTPAVPDPARSVRANPQQPEHDDGELALNFTTSSTAAEIAYFMRGNRLYRRVVLIRDPLVASGTNRADPNWTFDGPPGGPLSEGWQFLRHIPDSSGTIPLQTLNGQYLKYSPGSTGNVANSDDYWLDFDHAAVQQIQEEPAGSGTYLINGAQFVGTDQLNNTSAGTLNTIDDLGLVLGQRGASATPADIATHRFGFDQQTGISREFSHADPSQPGFFFIGRYTQEEMSHPDFNFPQNPSAIAGNNPHSYTDFPALADAGLFPDGTVDALAGGARQGQDLLLSNVQGFEIEVWDDRLGQFVQPGHSLTNAAGEAGDYHRGRNQQLMLTTPLVHVPGDAAAWSNPPFDRWTGRTFDTWHTQSDTDGNGSTTDPAPAPYRPLTYYQPGSAVAPTAVYWQPNTAYSREEVVFPTAGNVPADYSVYFICTNGGTSGANPTDEPTWPVTPGSPVVPDDPSSGEPSWLAVKNVRPLRAIRIRIRFLHESSGKIRQVSLVHTLVDNEALFTN
jgi:prepilin-type N-terminal cleavage/methylation domain-containing protein